MSTLTEAARARLERAQKRRRWWVVWLLCLGVLISYIDRANLSLAAVPVMRELGFSPAGMGALMSGFFWTYALFQIPSGYLIDRLGFRWIYAGAFLLWSLASAGIGLAHTFNQIFVLRLLLGAGEAIAAPASLAYIKRNFAEDEQGLPTGIYIGGMQIGPALGALLGGLLVDSIGWRPLFVLTGLGACLWIIPWVLVAPVRLGAKSAPAAEGPRPRLPWKQLALSPVTWGITVGAFFYSYFWYFCLTWLPSYLVMARGFSFSKMGAYMAMPLVAMGASSMLCGRLADRAIARGRSALFVRKAFITGGMLSGSSMLVVLAARTPHEVLVVLVVCLAGVGLAGANYWALTQLVSPPLLVGRVVGYQNTIAQFGGVAAPILTGVLIGRSNNFGLSIVFAGLAPLIAAAAILALMREPMVKRIRAAVEGQ